jgi:hypothetical protein
MIWATSAQAILALRSVIFDGPTDKLCSNKSLVGVQDGVNTIFKTFEYRRVTNFTLSPGFPQGVYDNGVLQTVTTDDPASGAFQVSVAPGPRDTFNATYYYQWFLDSDLDGFLQNASVWLGFNTTYINTPDGLTPALADYAAREAYRSAAMKYSLRMSSIYKTEDAPTEDIINSVNMWKEMAQDFEDSAAKQRDDYYTRQGQSLAPNFAFQLGRVTDPTPRR